MILVCVGTANPFNRLVRTVDMWAASQTHNRVFAQIGAATFHPQNFEHTDVFANDVDRDSHYNRATLLVCDLSVEILLPAIEHELPVLALPRLSIFGEEIGIDQITLAKHLKSDDFITVAQDEHQLLELLSMPRMAFSKRVRRGADGIRAAHERSKRFQTNIVQALREVS